MNELRAIHPTLTRVAMEDGEPLLYFSDGPPMVSGEFEWGSPTRLLVDELEDLLGVE